MGPDVEKYGEAEAPQGREASAVGALVMRPPQDMKKAVAFLANYMNTYDQQIGYEDYQVGTFIDDVLYGLGEALDPEDHKYASGFKIFKEKLRAYLSA